MAPLYNVAPVVPSTTDSIRHDSHLDTATSCVEMLRLIDSILRAFDGPQPTTSSKATFKMSWFARWTCPAISIGTGLAAIALRSRDLHVYKSCTHVCNDLYSGTLCTQDSFGDALSCTMESQSELAGIAIWRVLMFVSLFWPIAILSKLTTISTTTLLQVYMVGDLVEFVVFGTRKQCVSFIQACIWFSIWFPITAQARQWAVLSYSWKHLNNDSTVWPSTFLDVHFYVWRALLVYVLFTLCSVLAAIAGRALSLKFHSEDHFDRIKTYIANEKVIQMLTQPCRVPESIDLDLRDGGGSVTLAGFDCAHWSALLFVTRVIEGQLDISTEDSAAKGRMVKLAKDMQRKIAKSVAKGVAKSYLLPLSHIQGAARRTTWRTSQAPGDVHVDGCAVPMTQSRVGNVGNVSKKHSSIVIDQVIACAERAIASANIHARKLSNVRSLSMSPSSSSLSSSSSSSTLSGLDQNEWTCEPTDTDDHITPSNKQRVMRWLSKLWARCTSRIGHSDSDVPTFHGGIHSLHDLIHKTPHTYNQVEVDEADEQVDNARTPTRGIERGEGNSLGDDVMLGPRAQVHTWKLGYYLFWNLRRPRCTDPGLSRADVYAVARRIGMPAQRAWLLMDQNNDQHVTMDEVIRSVEQVYNNRTVLAKSLAESQTVVGQVQHIIHGFLWIVLAFATVAIFIPGGIPKAWTSMSAGLLSFSFIFGNSIREVFENCVFLFFTHPFDLGDKIRWDGETYFVRGITLNYVNLLHSSGSYVNLAAHILKDAAITNVTRSQRVWESIHFDADINTSVHQCEVAADKVVDAISTHPRLFGGMYRVWLSDTDNANKIKISAHFDLKTNGMDASMMGEAMTVMTAALADGLCDAGVSYTDLALACPTCWPKQGRSVAV